MLGLEFSFISNTFMELLLGAKNWAHYSILYCHSCYYYYVSCSCVVVVVKWVTSD